MVRKIVRAHAANSGTQERKSLLEILGGATCARAYTIKGQGQRVPYRLALLAAPTPPSTRQLRAPREALSPAKGRLPFRAFEFVRDAPLKLHDPLLLCLANNPPETFHRVGIAARLQGSGEVRRGYRVRRDQSGVQLVVVGGVHKRGSKKRLDRFVTMV
jgi:hypothetical protein